MSYEEMSDKQNQIKMIESLIAVDEVAVEKLEKQLTQVKALMAQRKTHLHKLKSKS